MSYGCPTFSAVRFNQMFWLKKKINSPLIGFAVLVKIFKGAVTKSNFSSNLSQILQVPPRFARQDVRNIA